MNKLQDLSKTLSPLALTALRVTVGIIFITHGWSKVMDYEQWTANVAGLGLPTYMAPVAIAGELGGGAGLVLGALTPVAALGVLSVMVTAIWKVHLGHGLLAQGGGFEYPLTMAMVAIFFTARGAGPYSVDSLIFGRGRRTRERRRHQRRAEDREVAIGGQPHEAHP